MKATYIFHSGFMIELENHVLVFDYYQKELPHYPANKKVYCFVTHFHQDHFNRDIFDLFPNATFILSKDTRIKETDSIHIVKKNETYEIGDLMIKTLRSTDAGVAFLVTVEDKVIYHAGDLNWWHWEGEPKNFNDNQAYNFKKEMAKLDGLTIDVAMLPLDPRQEENAWWGIEEILKHAQIKHILPMHFGDAVELMQDYLNEEPLKNYPQIHKIEHENQSFEI